MKNSMNEFKFYFTRQIYILHDKLSPLVKNKSLA